MDYRERFEDFHPTKDFLVCIDSDGCAFDTMGIKQRECFCPWMIAYFGLQPVAQAARECKEFADLFSKTRGANRHITIKRILTELLPTHPQGPPRRFNVPKFPHYFAWVDDPRSLLSNDGLRQAIDRAANEGARQELKHILAWSERVNWAVGEIVQGIPPFPYVRDSLVKLQDRADVVVVSATPIEALEREWQEHDIARYTALICGQEMGTKAEHIASIAGEYAEHHVLMIGDAPGDRRAARANDALFYPIIPGEEENYWKHFADESMERFFSGTYDGRYEADLSERFERALPDSPPWEVNA